MKTILRILFFTILCSIAFASDNPLRIVNISEICVLPGSESATIQFADEHGDNWRLRLAPIDAQHWSVAFGPVPKHEGEMAPILDQSGTYRKKLLQMLSAYCVDGGTGGILSRRLLTPLGVLAEEILKEPNQAIEPNTPAATILAAQHVAPAGVVAEWH